MTIVVSCTCGGKLKAKNELAGKRVKCPRCENVLRLPEQKEASPSIGAVCPCGQTLQARATLAGKKVKCPTCSQSMVMPGVPATTPVAPDPPGASGDPFDLEDWSDDALGVGNPLGAPLSGGQVAVSNFIPSPGPVASSARGEPSKSNHKKTAAFDAEVLIMVTAILCIIYGLWRIGSLYGIVGLITSGQLFSLDVRMLFGTLRIIATVLVSGGILAAGIGLLTKQEWGMSVGAIAGSFYFLVLIFDLILLMASLAGFESVSLGMFASMIPGMVAQAIIPGLLVYVTLCDS